MAKMIPARQYARQLNLHPNTVYAWIAKGQLPYHRRTGNNGAVRYYIDASQPPPRLAIGRPAAADPSLSEQLLQARIEYTKARTQLINDRREREAKEAEDMSNGVGISVSYEDEELEDLSE
jgi:hypothetical protein